MDSDFDMSEINDSNSSDLSDNIESDSDSTSGSTGGRDSDDDDENGFIFQALHSSLVVDNHKKLYFIVSFQA